MNQLPDSETMARQALAQFAAGPPQPSLDTIANAYALAQAALRHTRQPEIILDPGSDLSLDLRLHTPGGFLILAELTPEGQLNASIYDANDRPVETARCFAADELIRRFQD